MLSLSNHSAVQVPEIPLVVDDSAESITKTSKAVQVLKQLGAYEDAAKAKDSKNVRRGKGKMRNRRYVNRKGPLVVYGNDNGIAKAFRNLPGVDTAPVTALNLMQASPLYWLTCAAEEVPHQQCLKCTAAVTSLPAWLLVVCCSSSAD